MSAHTPRWRVERNTYNVLVVDPGAAAIALVLDAPHADLIAAAPDAVELLRDLLNAHEGAVNLSDDPFPDDLYRAREWLERIHAVLAKAKALEAAS